eukprot:4409932-Pyramimonas_sp.AAC.1
MGWRQCAQILAASGAPLATGVARLGQPLQDSEVMCGNAPATQSEYGRSGPGGHSAGAAGRPTSQDRLNNVETH